jgi:hypothetical protein
MFNRSMTTGARLWGREIGAETAKLSVERIQTEDPLGREVAAIGMNVAEGALRDGGWPVHMVNFSNRL